MIKVLIKYTVNIPKKKRNWAKLISLVWQTNKLAFYFVYKKRPNGSLCIFGSFLIFYLLSESQHRDL